MSFSKFSSSIRLSLETLFLRLAARMARATVKRFVQMHSEITSKAWQIMVARICDLSQYVTACGYFRLLSAFVCRLLPRSAQTMTKRDRIASCGFKSTLQILRSQEDHKMKMLKIRKANVYRRIKGILTGLECNLFQFGTFLRINRR